MLPQISNKNIANTNSQVNEVNINKVKRKFKKYGEQLADDLSGGQTMRSMQQKEILFPEQDQTRTTQKEHNKRQQGLVRRSSLAERFFKKHDDNTFGLPSHSNQNQFQQNQMMSPTSKQIFSELINSQNKFLSMSPDNLSGNILIFVKPEGQDRFKKQAGYSQQLKSLDHKINSLRNELDVLYQVKKPLKSQESLLEQCKDGDQQDIDEDFNQETNKFDFITQQQDKLGTLEALMPSAIQDKTQKSLISDANLSESSSQQMGVPSIHFMVLKAQKEEKKIASQHSNPLSELQENNLISSKSDYHPNHDGQMNSSLTQNSSQVDQYKTKLMNSSLISVKEQFTHVYDMYSKSIASAFHSRDLPKIGMTKKRKNPKFLICNSMMKGGIVNSKSEHMMRIFNKEHKPSQINICLPSFPTKKNSQEFVLATYMENYKPLKISKHNQVIDLVPRYLKENIERDIIQLKHTEPINSPPQGQDKRSSLHQITQKSSVDSQQWQKTGVFSELNKAFVDSSHQNSQENLETFNNFFTVSKHKL